MLKWSATSFQEGLQKSLHWRWGFQSTSGSLKPKRCSTPVGFIIFCHTTFSIVESYLFSCFISPILTAPVAHQINHHHAIQVRFSWWNLHIFVASGSTSQIRRFSLGFSHLFGPCNGTLQFDFLRPRRPRGHRGHRGPRPDWLPRRWSRPELPAVEIPKNPGVWCCKPKGKAGCIPNIIGKLAGINNEKKCGWVWGN
jgi:hypothetical protein